MSTASATGSAAPSKSTYEYVVLPWSLGWVGVAGSPAGVRVVHLADDPPAAMAGLQTRLRSCELIEAGRDVVRWAKRIVTQLESPAATADVPLDIQGTPFQKAVWNAMAAIPAGTTASYGDIAAKVGCPKGARAVGLACGSNPLAPMIPCHRVVRSDGTVGGYGFGVDRKQALLDRERQAQIGRGAPP